MKVRAIALCFLLAGCSAPTPNETLVSLGEQARSDSTSEDARYAAVRADQAKQLFDEVARLCGTNSEGETPEACAAPTATPTVTPLAPAAAATGVLDALEKVESSSLPRIAAIYTQLAMLAEPVEVTPPTSADSAMREWENAVVYGLEVAIAFSGSATKDVKKSLEHHQNVATALPVGTTPSPTAYDLSQYPDPDQTYEFLLALESDSVSKWQQSAVQSTDEEWTRYALIQAGNAAVRYSELAQAIDKDPMQAEFLQLR